MSLELLSLAGLPLIQKSFDFDTDIGLHYTQDDILLIWTRLKKG